MGCLWERVIFAGLSGTTARAMPEDGRDSGLWRNEVWVVVRLRASLCACGGGGWPLIGAVCQPVTRCCARACSHVAMRHRHTNEMHTYVNQNQRPQMKRDSCYPFRIQKRYILRADSNTVDQSNIRKHQHGYICHDSVATVLFLLSAAEHS
jgi:hypothetical protein